MLKGANVRKISAKLLPIDIAVIQVYIQGAVHGFCNNNAGQYFTVRSLFGGENADWNGTPLQQIYEHYRRNGYTEQDAADRAAVDVGVLLKNVLIGDKYEYEQVEAFTNTYYKK